MSSPAATDYRTLALLAVCQGLLLGNGSGLVSMNGLVGHDLSDVKELATLGATTYVLGSAVATMPASLWMGRVGRRRGFMTGAVINVVGCAVAVFALSIRSFALFCAATAIMGIYNAIGLQYRFAAAEVAAPADRAKAISWVLRTYARHGPALVAEFVHDERAPLPAVARREALHFLEFGRKRSPRVG